MLAADLHHSVCFLDLWRRFRILGISCYHFTWKKTKKRIRYQADVKLQWIWAVLRRAQLQNLLQNDEVRSRLKPILNINWIKMGFAASQIAKYRYILWDKFSHITRRPPCTILCNFQLTTLMNLLWLRGEFTNSACEREKAWRWKRKICCRIREEKKKDQENSQFAEILSY